MICDLDGHKGSDFFLFPPTLGGFFACRGVIFIEKSGDGTLAIRELSPDYGIAPGLTERNETPVGQGGASRMRCQKSVGASGSVYQREYLR